MSQPMTIRRHLWTIGALTLTATVATGGAGLVAAPSGATMARAARAQQAPKPPKTLVAIEEQAEDVIDRVPSKRWVRVAKDIAKIKATWAAYQARAKADGVPANVLDDLDSTLGRLSTAAKAKDGPDTLQAANDLSGALVEVFASYDLGHPIEIARLDIIGRQIGFDTAAGEPDAVAAQIDAARAQWGAIRDQVTAHSAAVGAQVDATLDALTEANAARNTGLLKAETRVLLETVDAMESLYE
jgi:hypothetical protein